MDTIHPWCPVTPVKSVKLHQGWIWFLLSLLIRNTTCPDILWGNICLRLFILAMLRIWKGKKKKKAAVGRKHKNTLCNVLPSFSLSFNNRAARWESGRCMKNSWARSPFWVSCPLDLCVSSSVRHAGWMNFGLWWRDESHGGQTGDLTVASFPKERKCKRPFFRTCFSHSLISTEHLC